VETGWSLKNICKGNTSVKGYRNITGDKLMNTRIPCEYNDWTLIWLFVYWGGFSL